MEKEEEDDDGGNGAIECPFLVLSNVEEPEEKGYSHSHEREEKIDQQIDVGILNSLIS